MFVEVAAGVRARLEPWNGDVFLIHGNRLRVVHRESESYRLLVQRLGASSWTQPFPEVPQSVQVQVTRACNFACSFCYAGAVNVSKPESHMSLDRARALIDTLVDWGVPIVQWVGGEAFVHKDFPSIVGYAQERGMVQTIITNGIIPGLQADKYRSTLDALSAAQVSVNAIGAAYDRLVGRRIFEKFAVAVRTLVSAVDQVWFSCVLTPDNYRDIPRVVSMAEDCGADGVIFGVLVKKGRAGDTSRSYFDFQRDADDMMRTVQERRPTVSIDYHFNSQLSYVHEAPVMAHCDPRTRRGEGFSGLFVNLSGDIYPFPTLEVPEFRVGNAFSDNVRELWMSSPVLNTLRGVDRAPHPCNGCPQDCALRSLSSRYLWFGSLEGKIPCARYEYQH